MLVTMNTLILFVMEFVLHYVGIDVDSMLAKLDGVERVQTTWFSYKWARLMTTNLP